VTRPAGRVLSRDSISFLGGWALVIHQAAAVAPPDFNLAVFLGGLALIGVPGAGAILAARSGALTSEPPSSPAAAESPPQQSS